MPPQLALIATTAFVMFLLYLERKQSPEVSWALWIPTFWMFVNASKPLGVWFGVDADAEGSPLDRVVFSGLLCLGLFMLAWKKDRWSSALRTHPWLVVLICYMFLSIVWSDIPYTSFKRCVRELLAIIMALLVLTERDPRQAALSVVKRLTYVLIPFSLTLIKYFPTYGVMYARWSGGQEWIGVTLQKNGLGRLCIISAFFLVWTLVRRWQGRGMPGVGYQTLVDVFVLAITIWLMKGPTGAESAYSATGIAALAGGLGMFISLLWMKKHQIYPGSNTLTAILALIIIFGIVTVITGGSTMGGVTTSTLGRDETVTGRVGIWKGLLPVAMERPILGYGVGGFWTPTTQLAHDIREAHNGYLEILLETGFVGIFFFSIFVLSCCRKAQKELIHDFDWACLWICFLVMFLLHNISESSINTLTNIMPAILLFMMISSSRTVSPKNDV
jgi:exopolysaccharide production protein ExoQ